MMILSQLFVPKSNRCPPVSSTNAMSPGSKDAWERCIYQSQSINPLIYSLIKKGGVCGRDGSEIKSTGCACREFRFDSQHPQFGWNNPNSRGDHVCVYVCMQRLPGILEPKLLMDELPYGCWGF